MRILEYELRGTMAHFRRPDTISPQATYPFITRTATLGLMAASLGLEELLGNNVLAIALAEPVHTSVQELSLLGKGWLGASGSTFNRPTAVEFVVNPRYIIYYSGPHIDRLAEMYASHRSVYHTYLGSACCPTFPELRGVHEATEIDVSSSGELITRTVVPSHSVKKLLPNDGARYSRVGAMYCEHLGDRRFGRTVNLVYEVHGGYLRILPKAADESLWPVRWFKLDTGEVICLW